MKKLIFVVMTFLAVAFIAAVPVSADSLKSGAVYAMTNNPAGNSVIVFSRDAGGALTKVGTVATNGLGFNGSMPDPLGSQNSIVLSENGNWLLAVNAGSNDVTVFRVTPGGLEFASKVGSGGILPTSIAIFGNNVFVLNADVPNAVTPNIVGFTLSNKGELTQVAGSTRSLGAGSYGQVGFDPQGRWLVVTDKAGRILVFSIGKDGLPAASAVATPSLAGTPFSFTFDNQGNLLVVAVNSPPNGAVSSYHINSDGRLTIISDRVLSGQVAACWITWNNGKVFTTNPGSHSISSYRETSTGAVSLNIAQAANGLDVIDQGISNNGKFLYAVAPGHGIAMFQINSDGSLISLGIQSDGGITGLAQGIAVR